MSTPAYIAHRTRGRIRIAIPSRRGDSAYFLALSKQLEGAQQVRRTRANPAAASLVVEFSGALDNVLAELGRGALKLTEPASLAGSAGTPPAPAVPGEWQLTPMFMAGAAFGVVGVIQTLRGEVMLPAMSAFWYAVNAFQLARTTGGSAADALRANLLEP
jgi:hypothetical protein